MYLVLALYDNSDPIAFGTFRTEDEAQKIVKKLRKKFDDYDHNHCTDLVVTYLSRKYS